MDIKDERETFRKAVQDVNRVIGTRLNISFEVVGWENYVLPDAGIDAQDVVNRQIRQEYDVFVGLFRGRVGTKTHRADSGTVEEYELALIKKKARPDLRLMCYFFDCEDPLPEIEALKRRMSKDGVLFADGITEADFPGTVFRHFSHLMLEYAKSGVRRRNARDSSDSFSSAVALTEEDGVVLVKRGASCRLGPGLWQIPGGKAESGESPEDAAAREIGEELGLTLDKKRLTRLTILTAPHLGGRGDLRMTLFTCPVSREELDGIRLNGENEAWELFPLSRFPTDPRPFLGVNRQMMAVLWREKYLVGPLAALVEHAGLSGGPSLPLSADGLPAEKAQTACALLSLLGLASVNSGVAFASEYSRRIVEEIVSLSRQDVPLFDNSDSDFFRDLDLPDDDYPRLRMHREKMMFSHRSLMSILSCRAKLKNSERNVTDVIFFGRLNGEIHVLLRWDFYAGKYQMISGGTDGYETASPEDRARAVVARRFSDIPAYRFDYHPMIRFRTRHFSAGSMDGDPVLREYDVEVQVATPRDPEEKDFREFVRAVNASTVMSVENFWGISRQQSGDLVWCRWCRLDELLASPGAYRGREVRGFSEILSRAGRNAFDVYLSRAICLEAEDVEEDGETDRLAARVKEKMKG